MAQTLRERLSELPMFPTVLPNLDADQAPADPEPLFMEWLGDAIDSGVRQPHAMTFVTMAEDGSPVARMLTLKDIDVDGFHFSTFRSSRKGQDLADRPLATMLFFWRESGRQVRVTGRVKPLSGEASAEDWQEQPTSAQADGTDWQLYTLDPETVEFMQARPDRTHTRLEYARSGLAWHVREVRTPGSQG